MDFLIPAFPNQFPYYELLFQGKLSAKTRTWAWKHTGWTLFYTSKSRIVTHVVDAYHMDVKDYKNDIGALVGIGYLLPVRPNTNKEIRRLEREFNNGGPKVIHAGWARYEFKPWYKFIKPIPYTSPKGAVTTFKVHYDVVVEALSGLGVDPFEEL